MKDQVHKFYWYTTFFQLFYIVVLILLSYNLLQNESLIAILRVITELITIPVVCGVLLCMVYFGFKLFQTRSGKQYGLIFSLNALTAGIMVLFTILQS